MRQDDRTKEQKKTHHWAVVARDTFLSGWGKAKGGVSRCAWAFPDSFLRDGRDAKLQLWVSSRTDMENVSVVDLDTYHAPKGTAHFQIYVVDESHPGVN